MNRNESEIRRLIADQARRSGICSQGAAAIDSALSVGELVDYYIANPDWCLERSFPDMATLRERFFNLGDRGVFVGRRFRGELLNERQTYIFHGCTGTVCVGLNVDLSLIPMLYVANRCRMRFIGVGDVIPHRSELRTEIPLYVFGPNDISAKDNRYVSFNRFDTPLQ